MLQTIAYLPSPVFEPSSEEQAACELHRLDKLATATLSAGLLRLLIYSSIATRCALPLWTGNRIQESDLLIAAHLHPPVWGVTRSLEQQLYLHQAQFCLGCNSYYPVEEGVASPLRTVCTRCYSSWTRPDFQGVPFWYTVSTWPVKYQKDLLAYLVSRNNHRTQLENSNETDG